MVLYTKADSDGNPNVFKVGHTDDGLWLNDYWAKPDNKWNPENQFVFSLRKHYLFPVFGGVLFSYIIQAFFPTPKHFADFIKFNCYFFVLFMRDQFCFPGNRNKKLKSVQSNNTF